MSFPTLAENIVRYILDVDKLPSFVDRNEIVLRVKEAITRREELFRFNTSYFRVSFPQDLSKNINYSGLSEMLRRLWEVREVISFGLSKNQDPALSFLTHLREKSLFDLEFSAEVFGECFYNVRDAVDTMKALEKDLRANKGIFAQNNILQFVEYVEGLAKKYEPEIAIRGGASHFLKLYVHSGRVTVSVHIPLANRIISLPEFQMKKYETPSEKLSMFSKLMKERVEKLSDLYVSKLPKEVLVGLI